MVCNKIVGWVAGWEGWKLTDIAYGQCTEMTQEGGVGDKGGDEDEGDERRGPCWDFVGADSYRWG